MAGNVGELKSWHLGLDKIVKVDKNVRKTTIAYLGEDGEFGLIQKTFTLIFSYLGFKGEVY